jgi:hypothetical protein
MNHGPRILGGPYHLLGRLYHHDYCMIGGMAPTTQMCRRQTAAEMLSKEPAAVSRYIGLAISTDYVLNCVHIYRSNPLSPTQCRMAMFDASATQLG